MSAHLHQYTVKADRTTGEWIGAAVKVGSVEAAAWAKKEDTDEAHFDTYEWSDDMFSELRAIEVVWQ